MKREKAEDMGEKERVFLDLTVSSTDFNFASSIESAISSAKLEMEKLDETIETVDCMRPDCDKLDYALAAGSGALCGIIDVFLVGKPGESPIGNLTDKWFADRTTGFAKLCGWDGSGEDSLASAVRFLEKKFKIPYDQNGLGEATKEVFDLYPANHHFKSLGHNSTLLGLFFSILDQFTNQSHFISGGELMSLQNADGVFELRGDSIPAKLFCGFVNWFGHLISDMSGSSGSKGRGMGIPSPIRAWTNDIIVIRRKLGIPASDFDRTLNDFAVSIYKQGFDLRFQTAQAIPVFINEIVVRLLYTVRRLIRYFKATEKGERSASGMWMACEPFTNATVKRMLTVAHGTFCLVDTGDATIRAFITGGGTFNVTEFFLRLNLAGVGRFTISLYGEAQRAIVIRKAAAEAQFAEREKIIVDDYLAGLYTLTELYDDRNLVTFIDDFMSSDIYVQAFNKSVRLAELRKLPDEKILKSKADIDSYFGGGRV